MLLVRLDDVVDEGAVLRQEHTGHLEGLAVPHFGGPHFDVLLGTLLLLHLRGLEADFGAHAEVGNHIENYLFQHSVLRELLEHIGLSVQLIAVHRSQIHDISDVEVVDPIVVVFHTEGIPDVDLVALIRFEGLNFTQAGKLSILVMRFSLCERQILLIKFLRDTPKLIEQRLHIQDLLFLNVCSFEDLVCWTEAVG